jgi:hypothetical protein
MNVDDSKQLSRPTVKCGTLVGTAGRAAADAAATADVVWNRFRDLEAHAEALQGVGDCAAMITGVVQKGTSALWACDERRSQFSLPRPHAIIPTQCKGGSR